MPLIKMGTAARRARVGSTNTIRRALNAAGVPLVTLSPGVLAVEEQDLDRFLRNRHDEPVNAPPPKARPKAPVNPAEATGRKPKTNKRRS
jgi:ribosomal protein L12E/L44/L45/RPP1/RPP2